MGWANGQPDVAVSKLNQLIPKPADQSHYTTRIICKKKTILQSSWKQKSSIAQTSFHHDKQHGLIKSVGKGYTYQN